MKRLLLTAAIGAAYASAAWGQAPPPGTYQFVSGSGPLFTVSGFSTSLGGSIFPAHLPNCAGLHVHGMFNGNNDPNSLGCGHGIIALVANVIPGASSQLPGFMPGSAAGMLALTRDGMQFKVLDNASPTPSSRVYLTYSYYDDVRSNPDVRSDPPPTSDDHIFSSNFYLTGLYALVARGPAVKVEKLRGIDASIGRQFFGSDADLFAYYGPTSTDGIGTKALDQARFEWTGDVGITLFGTPNPTLPQLRIVVPSTPPPGESILGDIAEPTLREIFGGTEPPKPPATKPAADAPDPEREKFLDQTAKDIADALSSGDSDKTKAAASVRDNAPKELQNRVDRMVQERALKQVNDAVRTSTSAAAQPSLSPAQMAAFDVRIRWDSRP